MFKKIWGGIFNFDIFDSKFFNHFLPPCYNFQVCHHALIYAVFCESFKGSFVVMEGAE